MASALSSIINQPHTAQRFKLHSPSCLTFFKHKHFSFFPPPKPFSISSPRPLHLFAASLNFSSLSNKSQNPSLRDFIAPASLTASQLQPRWVIFANFFSFSLLLLYFFYYTINSTEKFKLFFLLSCIIHDLMDTVM